MSGKHSGKNEGLEIAPNQISLLVVIARYLNAVDPSSLLDSAKKGLLGDSLNVAKAMIRKKFPDFQSDEVPSHFDPHVQSLADALYAYGERVGSLNQTNGESGAE